MDCSLSGSSAHGDSSGKKTGMGCHPLPQGIFPTQGSNPGLPHYRWILYHLSHEGSLLYFKQMFIHTVSPQFGDGAAKTQRISVTAQSETKLEVSHAESKSDAFSTLSHSLS